MNAPDLADAPIIRLPVLRLDRPDAPDATAGLAVPDVLPVPTTATLVERCRGRVRITAGTAVRRLARP